MAEMIGKITLDDTHYPGRDLYCDGIVEDEILDIVKSVPPEEYGRYCITFHRFGKIL